MTERARYRIQTVSELTGIPSATLRAWERRYGIPSPERTESSYRVYSDRDVELIRKLRSLCDDGLAPAEAARLVHRGVVQEGAAPDADPFAVSRAAILSAVENYAPNELEQEVRRAMFLGSALVVFEEIIAPALRVVGDNWQSGKLSIAQEHIASEVLGNAARDMLRLVRVNDRERVALLACAADEDHALALYGVAFRMVEWGFRPVILGARTPPKGLADAVSKLRPELVGLSFTLELGRKEGAALLKAYGDACAEVPWIVGGSASTALEKEISAAGGSLVTGSALGEAKAFVDGLLARRRRAAPAANRR